MTDPAVHVCRSCRAATRHVHQPLDQLVSFTCPRCGHRHDAIARPPLDAYVEKAAAALGGTVFDHCLLVAADGCDVAVSIFFDSGVAYAVELEVQMTDLPKVFLTRESAFDRRGRELGISREVQLDDPSFDPNVWIDAHVPDEVALRLLAAAPARAAVLAILAGEYAGASIRFDVRGILGRVGMSVLDDAKALRTAVDAMATLARSVKPDPVGASRPLMPRRRVILAIVLPIVAATTAAPIAVMALEHPPLLETASPYLLGGGAGLLVWILVTAPVLYFVVRGRASSFATFIVAALLWLVALVVDGCFLPLLLNWALDRSPRVARQTQIVALPRREEDANVGLTVRSWRGKGVVELRGPWTLDGGYVGMPLEVRTRRGFLGWEWMDSLSSTIARPNPPPRR